MKRELLSDLTVLRAVAEEGSFTRAAKRLGRSQPQLSFVVKRLEAALGLPLLSRNTRNLAPTQAGVRLLAILSPALSALESEIEQLSVAKARPTGLVRIAALEHAAETILWPRLSPLMHAYPEIQIEMMLDYGFNDPIAEEFDVGVRLGEQIEQDMIAVRIAPDLLPAVVASPAYIAAHGAPVHPQDLVDHRCINLWQSRSRGLFQWEFEKDGRRLRVRVDGQFTFNSLTMLRHAALNGYGLAYVPADIVSEDVGGGRLLPVLEDWCRPVDGYHLYFANKRHQSAALRIVIEALHLPLGSREPSTVVNKRPLSRTHR